MKRGTEVDLADGDHVRENLAIHRCTVETMSAVDGSGRQMPAAICPTKSDIHNSSCPARLTR